MHKTFIQSLVFGLTIFTSGCVSLLPEADAPKPRYHVEAVDASLVSGSTVNWSLVVDEPRATRVYDTVKIAVSPTRGKIEYFANAEWADRGPRLFQTALIQSFEDSGRILSVGDRHAQPIGDIVLQTDLRHMQIDVIDGAETPVISVYARLSDGKGTIYAAKLFEADERAEDSSPDEVINAFDRAFDTVYAELINWSFEQGESALSNR